jgi:hypothetical protein
MLHGSNTDVILYHVNVKGIVILMHKAICWFVSSNKVYTLFIFCG